MPGPQLEYSGEAYPLVDAPTHWTFGSPHGPVAPSFFPPLPEDVTTTMPARITSSIVSWRISEFPALKDMLITEPFQPLG